MVERHLEGVSVAFCGPGGVFGADADELGSSDEVDEVAFRGEGGVATNAGKQNQSWGV
jgi:hypothetical protein